jgi:AcrR family transcriptional regulator
MFWILQTLLDYDILIKKIKSEVISMSEKAPDRRTQRTRKALFDALAELLTEKQLHKVTVQEISDMAQVNRVTFYNHFLDVYDLYDKIEENTLVELGLLVLQLEELPAQEFFKHIIEYINDNRTIFKMIFSPNATGQLRYKLNKLIEGVFRQIQTEKLKADINDKKLEYISCYRAQGCLAVISKWVLEDFREPNDFIIKAISSLDSSLESSF